MCFLQVAEQGQNAPKGVGAFLMHVIPLFISFKAHLGVVLCVVHLGMSQQKDKLMLQCP